MAYYTPENVWKICLSNGDRKFYPGSWRRYSILLDSISANCNAIYVLALESKPGIWISVIPSAEGKRSMMKLAQRMVSNFCASISTSNSHKWTTISGMNEIGVRVTVHKSNDPGQPNGVVLSAATTIWLPISSQAVFNFFKDETKRPQVLFAGKYHNFQNVI